MNYEILTILLSIFGIGFTLDSRFTKQTDEQNHKIEKLYEISQTNANNIKDISYYLKNTQFKIDDLEKNVNHIVDLNNNGHIPNRILKINESTDKEAS
jgi:hypothetical protein